MRSPSLHLVLTWLRAGLLFLAAFGGVRLGAQSIPNPSFEANTYTVFPGYSSGNGGAITGWSLSGGVGLNPASGSPFADNGAIPNGSNVAFLQGTASLSTTISGLVVGQTYTVTFRSNRRAANFDPIPSWSLNGGAFASFTASPAVGSQNAYYTVSGSFNATATTAALVVRNTSVQDATLLVDNFTIGIVPAHIAVYTGASTAPANARTDNAGTQTFASTAVGSSSAAQTFTIQSTGTGNLAALALSITGANAGDFSVSALGATTVAPNGTTTFTVTFSPTAAGSRSAVINIASNDSGLNPFRINVAGTGLVPQLNVFAGASTALVNALTDNVGTQTFGSVVSGSSGTPRTFTIQNTGGANLTGLQLSTSGTDRTDFVAGNLGATTLAPNATTTFTVTFSPTAGGSRSALVNLGSNDSTKNPFRINVSGTGLVPQIAVYNGASTAPGNARTSNVGTYTLPGTPLGESSAAQTFTIQNAGTATLGNLSLSVIGANAADITLGTLGATSLAPGATTTFTVTFAPAALGARTATVYIASNDPNINPFQILLAGTGLSSRNANLSALVPGAGTLAPAFASATTSYSVSVPFLTTSITLTPTPADANATVRVNGTTPATLVALSVGANAFPVVVTAQDGTTTKTYTVTVTRGANQPPVAVADTLIRSNNLAMIKVTAASLVANDTDPEGDTLSLTAVANAQPSGATVTLVGGFVVYIAPSATAGNGSFTYTLSDGAGGHSVTGSVTVTQVAAAADTLTANAVSIVSSGGNYTLTFIGVSGNPYRVQYTTSATPPYVWNDFSPAATVTAPANGIFQYVDVNPPNPVRLYRAIANR